LPIKCAANEVTIEGVEHNGGQSVSFTDTTYPLSPDVLDFETLDAATEASDPLAKIYQSNRDISAQKIGLQRSLALPKSEVGYHSQGILGLSYKSVHIGASIPLWENRNRIRVEKANLSYSELQLSSHKVEHRN
jgi:outer membrane protein, heavy metal efflux system